jgi:glycerophosphoryl diester phosphodiesterase
MELPRPGAPSGRPPRPYLVSDHPLFFAHRGGSALAPENTLVAFERGLSYGADALETDVHATRDGEIVVLHDATVNRTTNGAGPVAVYTLDELRALDAGFRFTPDGGRTYPFRGIGVTIPTLREALERFPNVRINIEMKAGSPESEQRLWRIIQEFGAQDRVLVASFPLAPLARFRALTKGRVATAATLPEMRVFLLAAYARRLRWLRPAYDALQVPRTWRGIPIVTSVTVAAAHQLGLAVHVWTVDERARMQRLLALGVDGLMSDRPDILQVVLAEHARSHQGEP